MKAILRGLISRAEIGLPALLAIALLGRLPAVVWSRGYEFLDEQFQYVEPAWSLVQGTEYTLTHEWVLGIRSWVYPWLLSRVMLAASALGLDAPETQMVFIRFVHALVSLLAVAGLHDLLAGGLKLAGARPLLWFLALNGLAIYQGVHPNGPGFSCGLVVFAVCMFLRGGALRAVLAGLALGLGFCCRPQDGLFGVPLLLAGVWRRRALDTVLFSAGALVMVGVQGLVDLYTWGSFLHSPIGYVRFNLTGTGNTAWGQEPWFYYLVLLLLLAPLFHAGIRWVLLGVRLLPWVAVAVLFYLGVHSLVDHKAPRFVTPGLVLFLLLWGCGVLVDPRPRGRLAAASIGVALVMHLAGFALASFSYPFRAEIETARFLGRQPENRGAFYYDRIADDTTGDFYYRSNAPRYVRPRMELDHDPAGQLAARLSLPDPPTHLVARSGVEPVLPPGWRAERVHVARSMNPFRRRGSLVVYTLLRSP